MSPKRTRGKKQPASGLSDPFRFLETKTETKLNYGPGPTANPLFIFKNEIYRVDSTAKLKTGTGAIPELVASTNQISCF